MRGERKAGEQAVSCSTFELWYLNEEMSEYVFCGINIKHELYAVVIA